MSVIEKPTPKQVEREDYSSAYFDCAEELGYHPDEFRKKTD